MGVEQRFRDSDEYEPLEPYLDNRGLVAGYSVERFLHRDPWRYTTYVARAPDGTPVALKLLHARSGESRRAARDFQRCVRQRASIEHPHLLPILDWGKLGDRYYLATALCEEATLADLLEIGGLKANGCLRLLAQLADALETAHECGLVHRELAPENVFVAARGGGHVLLDDFGVANQEWGTGLLGLAESSAYLSPEMLRDEPLTPESNVYSLTCILVECLTGSPPYTSELAGGVAYAHVAEPPPRLSERSCELPEALDDVVAAGMAKDPAERLRSARRLIAEAARSLGFETPAPLLQRQDPRSRGETASRNGASGERGLALRSVPGLQHALHPGRPLRRARRALPAWGSRNGRLATLAAVIVGAGGLGYVLGGFGVDERPSSRTVAADAARLRVERERATLLRKTDVVLTRLDTRRAVARRRLATARTVRGQAAEAASLASDYRDAARMLPREFRSAAGVVSALNTAGRAYDRLAAAARRRDRGGYAAAGAAVRSSEGHLQQAIVRLGDARR